MFLKLFCNKSILKVHFAILTNWERLAREKGVSPTKCNQWIISEPNFKCFVPLLTLINIWHIALTCRLGGCVGGKVINIIMNTICIFKNEYFGVFLKFNHCIMLISPCGSGRDSSKICSTAPIFSEYNYFRQNICGEYLVQFHFLYIYLWTR